MYYLFLFMSAALYHLNGLWSCHVSSWYLLSVRRDLLILLCRTQPLPPLHEYLVISRTLIKMSKGMQMAQLLHWLLFLRTQVQSQAPTWQLTTNYICSSRESNVFLMACVSTVCMWYRNKHARKMSVPIYFLTKEIRMQ